MISIFLNLLRLVLCLSVFENVPCAFEKTVYFASLVWKGLHVSLKSIWSRALFSATISLLIFCLEDPSFLTVEIPYCNCVLSIFILKSSRIFFMSLGALILDTYIFTMFTSSWWILPLSIMKWPSVCLFLWPMFWSLFCQI